MFGKPLVCWFHFHQWTDYWMDGRTMEIAGTFQKLFCLNRSCLLCGEYEEWWRDQTFMELYKTTATRRQRLRRGD